MLENSTIVEPEASRYISPILIVSGLVQRVEGIQHNRRREEVTKEDVTAAYRRIRAYDKHRGASESGTRD